jgi:TetR/AcrR family transcriptional repressor of nem operon
VARSTLRAFSVNEEKICRESNRLRRIHKFLISLAHIWPVATARPNQTSRAGRPRRFKEEKVLAEAADAFWKQGYHATSVDNLCKATGLLRGSLYGAFGDKRGILLAALRHYSQMRINRLSEILKGDGPSRQVLHNGLFFYIETISKLDHMRACLITNTAMEMLPRDAEVAGLVESIFRRLSDIWSKAVLRAQNEGHLSSDSNSQIVGNFLLCITQGLRVLGKVFSPEELSAVAELALRVLETKR